MKVIIEKPIGGDGAKAGLYLEEGYLEVKVQYPVAKIVEPIKNALEPLKAKLKDIIPGDWENPLVDKAFDAAMDEVVKLLSEA